MPRRPATRRAASAPVLSLPPLFASLPQTQRRRDGRAAFDHLGPTAQARTIERVLDLFAAAPWTYARTYHETFPHWYSRRDAWTDPASFTWAVSVVEILAYPQRFNGGLWLVLPLHDGHLYWAGWESPRVTRWLNRRPLRAESAP